MKGKSLFIILFSFILFFNLNFQVFAEELEPIEDPKIYKKFDILEGISKKDFAKRLEEQERILDELEDKVDIFQYSMFREQYHKNVAYYEENYKTIFTKIKEFFQAVFKEILSVVGFFIFMMLFGLVLAGGENLTDDEIMYMYEEEEREGRRIKQEIERRNREEERRRRR